MTFKYFIWTELRCQDKGIARDMTNRIELETNLQFYFYNENNLSGTVFFPDIRTYCMDESTLQVM